MKKIIIWLISIIITLLLIVYWLNPKEIYQLNNKTTQFIDYQSAPEGTHSLKASDCGLCHAEIYQEWQTSLHSKAFVDPFFTAYHKKDKGDPTCLVCHTPLANQSPLLISLSSAHSQSLKSRENPNYDPELQKEGVNCAGCHVRKGIVYGPYKARVMSAPHPVAFDQRFLDKTLCKQCHEVPSKDFSLMKEGICSTGRESNAGIWAARGFICQDCHMPATERPLMTGFPSRAGRKHLWPGGYSTQQLQKVFSFKAQKINDKIKLTITNSGAGHKAPTGDTDRFITLDFIWQDKQGKQTILETIKFKRQVIWQPIMFVFSDNRLGPGKSTSITVKAPESQGKLLVNAVYHVMTDTSLQRLKEKYQLKNGHSVHRQFITNQEIRINQ